MIYKSAFNTEVEAVQWDGTSYSETPEWLLKICVGRFHNDSIIILEGVIYGLPATTWIIRTKNGDISTFKHYDFCRYFTKIEAIAK